MPRQTKLLQNTFDMGIRRDTPRNAAPAGSLYACTDYLPNISGFPLRNRGGWTDLSASFGDINGGTSTQIMEMIHAPFESGAKLLVVGSDGKMFPVDTTTGNPGVTAYNLTGVPWGDPCFFLNYAIFPSDGSGVAGHHATKFDGSAITFLNPGGTGYPITKHYWPYKSRLLAANNYLNPNRWWLSNPNDVTTWDLTNNYFDTQQEILAVGAVRNAALLFHAETVTRVRGTTPGALGDIEQDNNYFNVGIAGWNGPASISYWKDNIIWADAQGVYMSDGAAFVNLVERGGIRALWNYDLSRQAAINVATGILRDYLFVTIWNASNLTQVATYVCYLPARSWVQATNFPFFCFAEESSRDGTSLWAGRGDRPRVSTIDSVLLPGKTDGDGTSILPSLETNFFRQNFGDVWMDRIWAGYSLRATSGTPHLDVTATKVVGSNQLTQDLGDLALTSTSATAGEGYARKRLPFKGRGEGVALKIAASAAADEIGLYSLEAEFNPMAKYR